MRRKRKKAPIEGAFSQAEGVGFEPTGPRKAQRFSRPSHSSALSPLQNDGECIPAETLIAWAYVLRTTYDVLQAAEGGPHTVHPAVECFDNAACRTIDSTRAVPQHPEPACLGLLPSGPDPVHSVPPPWDPGFNIDRTGADPSSSHPQAGSSAPHEGGFGRRAPLAPHLARSCEGNDLEALRAPDRCPYLVPRIRYLVAPEGCGFDNGAQPIQAFDRYQVPGTRYKVPAKP